MTIETRFLYLRGFLLLAALVWTFNAAMVARSQAVRLDDLRRVETRVDDLARDQASETKIFEVRLTRLETQIAALIETNNWAVKGIFGTLGLFIFQAIWGLIVANKPLQKARNTNP